MATWTPSSPTIGPQAIVSNGGVYFTGDILSAAGPYGAVRPCSGDVIFIQGSKFGTLTNDCSLEVWFSSDDGAASFGVGQSIANSVIQNANGFSVRVPVSGKFWRAFFVVGTTTGANGLTLSGRH